MTDQKTDLDSLRRQADDPTEEQIIAQIEVTRTEMSGTIDEIGHRLNPQVIADQAREQIREATVGRVERIVNDAGETAQQTGNTIMGTIRENPVPAGLAALGIGWLALRMRDQQSPSRQSARGYPRQPTRDWYAREAGTGQGRYGVREAYAPPGAEATGRAADGEQGGNGGGADLAERSREMSEQAQRTAREVSDQAQETWQDVQLQAHQQTQNIQRQFDRTLDENPLALGALAVGVGAAVALAIPETAKERALMGEQRDQLLSQVEDVASRALGEAEQGAREAGAKARDESRS